MSRESVPTVSAASGRGLTLSHPGKTASLKQIRWPVGRADRAVGQRMLRTRRVVGGCAREARRQSRRLTHTDTRGFEGLVNGAGQVIPDRVEVDGVFEPGRERSHGLVGVIAGCFEPGFGPGPDRIERAVSHAEHSSRSWTPSRPENWRVLDLARGARRLRSDVLARDRQPAVRLLRHREVPYPAHLPQAGRLEPGAGGEPGPGRLRGLTSGRPISGGNAIRRQAAKSRRRRRNHPG
jgi:hypothetical protein